MSNQLPEGWKESTLSDFASINPKIKSNVELTKNTKVSFIKMEDVSNDAKVIKKHVRNYSEVAKGFTRFNNNDVLVAKITPCFENGKGGYVDHLVNGVGFGSTEFHVLRSTKVSDSKYLYQYTNYDAFRLEAEASMCGTGGQRRVQTEFMKTYKISYPPLPEQQKIAAILTSVDDVIEKTQAQINKLKDLKTGMMQELLTRGVGVDGKPHTEFKDSPVGRIPKDWGVVKLSSVLSKIDSGWSPSCIEVPPESGQWGVIKVSAVTRGSFLEIESKTLPDGLSPKPLIRIKKGDILLTRANGVADLVGKCVLVLDEPKANLMMSDKILRLNYSKAIHPYYLLYYFNSRTIRKQIELSWGGSSGQKNISQADIKNYLIALPSLEEQKIIGDAIFRVDQLWANKKEKLTKLEQLKKALMQDLLTGKVRVKVD